MSTSWFLKVVSEFKISIPQGGKVLVSQQQFKVYAHLGARKAKKEWAKMDDCIRGCTDQHFFLLPIRSWYLNISVMEAAIVAQWCEHLNFLPEAPHFRTLTQCTVRLISDIGQTSEVQKSVVKLRAGTPFNFSANLVDTRLYSSGSAVSNKYLLDGKLYRGTMCWATSW